MKKLLLLLSAVTFYNSTQAQPVVPSTTPYTRTLLPLPTQAAWQTALGISGGGGGAAVNLAAGLTWTNDIPQTGSVWQRAITLTVGHTYLYTPVDNTGNDVFPYQGSGTDASAYSLAVDPSGLGSVVSVGTTNNLFVATQAANYFLSLSTTAGATIGDTLYDITTNTFQGTAINAQNVVNGTMSGTLNGGGRGATFQSIVTVFPTNGYNFNGTISAANGGSTLTAVTGTFTYTNSAGTILRWCRGFQISLNGTDQFWVADVTDATHARIVPVTGKTYTAVGGLVSPPGVIVTDLNGKPQMIIQGDGSVSISSGTLGGNGDSPNAGRLRFEDGGFSMGLGMFEPNTGPYGSEMLGMASDTNGTGAPSVAFSPYAPFYSFAVSSNGCISIAGATNKPMGQFILNGTSAVTVGNTLVTTNTIVIMQEQSANGGTQLGAAFTTAKSAGVSFTVKGGAADTSICNYWLVKTN